MKNQEFYPDGSSNLTASARWKNLFRAVPLLLIAGIYLFFARWGTVGALISIVLLFFAIILVLDPDWSKKETESVPYLSIPLFISIFLLITLLVQRNNHVYGLSYDRQDGGYYEEPVATEKVIVDEGKGKAVEEVVEYNTTTTNNTSTKKDSEKQAIVGTWIGTYQENASTHDHKLIPGKGNLTLTVRDDMTGIIETIVKRKGQQPIKASYTVAVTYANGVFNVTGKEFIIKPNNYGFDNFNGSVSNGIFSGNNFKFENKKTNTPKDSEKQEIVGTWDSKEKKEKQPEKVGDKKQGEERKSKDEDEQKRQQQALALNTAEKMFRAGDYNEALKNYELAGEAGKSVGYDAFKNKAVELISLLDECDSNTKALLLKAQQLNDTQEIRNLLSKCK
jgi:hypothetical protein